MHRQDVSWERVLPPRTMVSTLAERILVFSKAPGDVEIQSERLLGATTGIAVLAVSRCGRRLLTRQVFFAIQTQYTHIPPLISSQPPEQTSLDQPSSYQSPEAKQSHH